VSNLASSQFRTVNVVAQEVDCKGAACVPLTLDFTANTNYSADLSNFVDRGFVSGFQAIFADNSANPSPLQIYNPTTGQSLYVPSNSQGYILFLCPNPAKITFFSNGNVIAYVQLLNFPVSNCVWKVT
jgi:hypothetical protein